MHMTEKSESTQQARQRREWLAVLARAPREALAEHASHVLRDVSFDILRKPETGLVMVRARIGNTGDRFNLGESTITRCIVRHHAADGRATAGVGYVLGRDSDRAVWVASFDALLQQPAHHESRVRFFTLQPEVAAA